MSEETNELNEKDVERIADALYQKMKIKQEKEEQEKHDKEKGKTEGEHVFYAVCLKCGRVLTREQYLEPACYNCGGTKATIITK